MEATISEIGNENIVDENYLVVMVFRISERLLIVWSEIKIILDNYKRFICH